MERMRSQAIDCPVLILTADSWLDENGAHEVDAQGFIQKPFSLNDLLNGVAKFKR